MYGNRVYNEAKPADFYTSYAINKKTLNLNSSKAFGLPADISLIDSDQNIVEFLTQNSHTSTLTESLDMMNSISILRACGSHDAEDLTGELLTATIYDIVYSNNKK